MQRGMPTLILPHGTEPGTEPGTVGERDQLIEAGTFRGGDYYNLAQDGPDKTFADVARELELPVSEVKERVVAWARGHTRSDSAYDDADPVTRVELGEAFLARLVPMSRRAKFQVRANATPLSDLPTTYPSGHEFLSYRIGSKPIGSALYHGTDSEIGDIDVDVSQEDLPVFFATPEKAVAQWYADGGGMAEREGINPEHPGRVITLGLKPGTISEAPTFDIEIATDQEGYILGTNDLPEEMDIDHFALHKAAYEFAKEHGYPAIWVPSSIEGFDIQDQTPELMVLQPGMLEVQSDGLPKATHYASPGYRAVPLPTDLKNEVEDVLEGDLDQYYLLSIVNDARREKELAPLKEQNAEWRDTESLAFAYYRSRANNWPHTGELKDLLMSRLGEHMGEMHATPAAGPPASTDPPPREQSLVFKANEADAVQQPAYRRPPRKQAGRAKKGADIGRVFIKH